MAYCSSRGAVGQQQQQQQQQVGRQRRAHAGCSACHACDVSTLRRGRGCVGGDDIMACGFDVGSWPLTIGWGFMVHGASMITARCACE
jgi:hypothetical protein